MKLTIYRGMTAWYWRAQTRNGRIVAVAGEGYTRRGDALRSAKRFCLRMRGVVEVVG